MKIIFKILIVGMLFLSQQTVAQNPAISTKYSDTEIEEMMNMFQAMSKFDTYPKEVIQEQFKKGFSKASNVDWEVAAGIFEADFEIAKKDYKAYYDTNGNLLMYTVEIKSAELPLQIRNAVQTNYAGFKLDKDSEKISQGKGILYKVKIEKSETEIKAIFKEDGSFVKEYFD